MTADQLLQRAAYQGAAIDHIKSTAKAQIEFLEGRAGLLNDELLEMLDLSNAIGRGQGAIRR